MTFITSNKINFRFWLINLHWEVIKRQNWREKEGFLGLDWYCTKRERNQSEESELGESVRRFSRGLRETFESKWKSRAIQVLSKRIQVLGVLVVWFIVISYDDEFWIKFELWTLAFFVLFTFSGFFPETAWRRMNCRQALHYWCCFFFILIGWSVMLWYLDWTLIAHISIAWWIIVCSD